MPETLISHYRVLHPLAAGGMGEVYAGVDETLKRRVALKAVRADYRLNREAKARFLREARILSQLDHAHICRVYDYIEGADNDWLVLELIEGMSLKAALKTALSPSLKLRIAEQIADVLVATHAAGVVHRDLKPTNVMLTRDAQVKVLDFGLAQSRDGESLPIAEVPNDPAAVDHVSSPDDATDIDLTRPASALRVAASFGRADVSRFRTSGGAVMGTLAYMSPEQARGDPATTASDMFSFGLVLQEIFTGRHPYPDDLDPLVLLGRVREGTIARATELPSDLASVIARLTAPAPAQRPTAVEAAAQLRRIRDKPRRRLRTLAAVGVLAVVAVGTVKYAVDLSKERAVAVEARRQADLRRGQAEDLIGFMLGDLRKKLEPVGRLEILDDVGSKAMDYFARVPATDLSDTELLRRSTALYQIGTVRIAQGRLQAAIQPLQESLAVGLLLVERKPGDSERLYGLGQSQFWVGYVHWRQRHLDQALSHFRAYLETSERLVALAPDNVDWQLELSSAHSNLGSILQERGDLPAALERFRSCLRIEQQLLARRPDDSELRRNVAASNNATGVVLKAMGQLGEALACHRAELAIQEDLVRRDPGNAKWRMYLGVAHNHVGIMLESRGMVHEALGHFRAAVEICNELVSADPTNMDWRRELGRNHFRLGHALIAWGGRAEALDELRQAVTILDAVAARDRTNAGWQRDLAEARQGFGEVLLAGNDDEGAAAQAVAALKLADAVLGSSPDDRQAIRLRSLAFTLEGQVWSRRGNARRAVECWEQSLAAIEPVARSSSDDRFLEPWAIVLVHLKRRDEAKPILEKLSLMGYRNPILLRIASSAGLRLFVPSWLSQGRGCVREPASC
jgi:serine/threonine-protein kinase